MQHVHLKKQVLSLGGPQIQVLHLYPEVRGMIVNEIKKLAKFGEVTKRNSVETLIFSRYESNVKL